MLKGEVEATTPTEPHATLADAAFNRAVREAVRRINSNTRAEDAGTPGLRPAHPR